MHYVSMYINISIYNLLDLYNIICMYVLENERLYWMTIGVLFLKGDIVQKERFQLETCL